MKTDKEEGLKWYISFIRGISNEEPEGVDGVEWYGETVAYASMYAVGLTTPQLVRVIVNDGFHAMGSPSATQGLGTKDGVAMSAFSFDAEGDWNETLCLYAAPYSGDLPSAKELVSTPVLGDGVHDIDWKSGAMGEEKYERALEVLDSWVERFSSLGSYPSDEELKVASDSLESSMLEALGD